MSKKKERQEKVKRAIENGERIGIMLTETWGYEGILVEQNDEDITIVTDEGITIIFPQKAVKAVWIKEDEGRIEGEDNPGSTVRADN